MAAPKAPKAKKMPKKPKKNASLEVLNRYLERCKAIEAENAKRMTAHKKKVKDLEAAKKKIFG